MDEEQIEFKNEPIDQNFILASIENTNMKSLPYNPKIKQEVSETNTKSKICDESENLEESGIFVKSGTDIKPEIIFGTSESDLQHLMSDVISSDPLDLTAHEQKYRINIKCSFCPKRFGATLDLKNHLDTEHKVVKPARNAVHEDKKHLEVARKMNYKCSVCSYLFSQKSALEDHYSRFHKIKTLSRPQNFKSVHEEGKLGAMLDLKKNLDTEHKVIKPAKNASLTHKMTSGKDDSNTNMDQHIIKANKENCWIRIKCHLCFAIFDSRLDFNEHFTNQHTGGKQAENTEPTHKIVKVHEGKEDLQCPICFKLFTRPGNLKQHIDFVHEGIKPHKCPKCDVSFPQYATLKAHMLTVHEEKSTEHAVGMQATNSASTHKMTILKSDPLDTTNHTIVDLNKPFTIKRQEGCFKCSVCLKVFPCQIILNRHLSVHKARNETTYTEPKIKKTWKCECCFEMFSKRNDLKNHIGKVHGVKCNFCPEYVKKTIMSEHIALFHLIKCHFCPKKIAKGGDMNAHVASAHGIKCQFCPEKLTYKNMYHHIKVFHKNDLKIQKKI